MEGISKEDAMQKYIDAVNDAFLKAAEQVDVDEWLSGDGLDPSIKVYDQKQIKEFLELADNYPID